MLSTNKLTKSIVILGSIACSVLASTLLTIDKSAAESVQTIHWRDSANHLRLESQIDRDFTFMCPENGSIAEITGTDLYATSSSICTAAAHAGVIKVATGGLVKIKIKPEADVYQGSTQHGIESSSNGPPVYNSSFIVLDANGRSIPAKQPVQKLDLDTGF
jgi:LCCL domain